MCKINVNFNFIQNVSSECIDVSVHVVCFRSASLHFVMHENWTFGLLMRWAHEIDDNTYYKEVILLRVNEMTFFSLFSISIGYSIVVNPLSLAYASVRFWIQTHDGHRKNGYRTIVTVELHTTLQHYFMHHDPLLFPTKFCIR